MFRRRADDAAISPSATPETEGGKGKPTPSRKAAEAERRQRLKESARGTNRSRSAQRAEDRARRDDVRERMREGDERVLGKRDRGPARRLARDLVDSRRTVGEFFLVIALGVLVAGIMPVPAIALGSQFVLIGLIIAAVTDSYLVHRRVVPVVRERFPDDEGLKGIGRYAIMRAMSTRRMRLPAPQVRRGTDVLGTR